MIHDESAAWKPEAVFATAVLFTFAYVCVLYINLNLQVSPLGATRLELLAPIGFLAVQSKKRVRVPSYCTCN